MPPHDPERWAEVRRILSAAFDAEDRTAFLDAECPDPEIRAEVERLLAADEGTGLQTRSPELTDPDAGWIGAQIGSFRVLRVLGSGGMGTVLEAEQERPRRRVAIKTMRFGLQSERARRRFEYESEVLARLKHHGIAQVFEVGTFDSPDGERPYYAMELVEDAVPFDRYARDLPLAERIELFCTVCDAVHHGHLRGFIHRDLKPQNVLVDGSGRAKVIDFGIARATADTDAQLTMQTEPGNILGTLQYMSPEQLQSESIDLDTRCDVYALGVILYELLTGSPPFHLVDKPLAVATAWIRERAPDPPSTIIELPTDLDWIVGRAMEKDRDRRYSTAQALAVDLARFLRGEAVEASPPSRTYRLRKLVRRHRLEVGLGSALFVALIAGTVVSTIGLLAARDAEALAKQHAKTAEEEADRTGLTLHVFKQVFGKRVPGRSGRDVRVADVLDEMAAKAEDLYRGRPKRREAMMSALSVGYQGLGLLDQALHFARRQAEIAEQNWGPDHFRAISSKSNIGMTLLEMRKLEAAEPILRQVFEARVRELGVEHQQTNVIRKRLGDALVQLGRWSEAEEMLRGVIAQTPRDRIATESSLVVALQRANKLQEAETQARKTLAASLKEFGEDDRSTLTIRNNLAGVLRMLGRSDESETMMRKALATSERILGEGHADTLTYAQNLAAFLHQQKKHDAAIAAYRDALERHRRSKQSNAMHQLVLRGNLAAALRDADRPDEAIAVFDAILREADGQLPKEHWIRGAWHKGRGDCLRAKKEFAESEKALLRAHALFGKAFTADHLRMQKIRRSLVALYEAWGKPESAEPYRPRR